MKSNDLNPNHKINKVAHRLTIYKFGPIDDAELAIKDFMILIGPQASGKSTISKLIYFFLDIRDELINFMEDSVDENVSKFDQLAFTKRLNQRILDFFSTSPRSLETRVSYQYTNEITITFTRNVDNLYMFFDYSYKLRKKLSTIYENHKKGVSSKQLSPSIFDSTTRRERRIANTKLRVELAELLNFDNEILYIPAGRSFLSILAGHLQDIHPHTLDYPVRRFIERVNLSKKVFGKGMTEIVEEYTATRLISPNLDKINPLIILIKQILKGEYRDHIEGGRLYIDNKDYIKINFASSGQQEALWILLLLFLTALENAQAYIFIEEPEAHLYPFAQKDMIALICYLHNQYRNHIFITTHSPYILATVNDHIYAGKLGLVKPKNIANIVPASQWVDPHSADGYLVEHGVIENIFDVELSMFKTEVLDRVSAEINTTYDQLMEWDDAAK